MAAKPLSLKREKARRLPRAGKFASVAEVILDHDLAHLDKGFTYGIPESLANQVELGSIVRVSFNGSEIDGVVIALGSNDEAVKPISKVVKSSAYSSAAIRLAAQVAKRYATSPIKILNLFETNYDKKESFKNASKYQVERAFIPESIKTLAEVADRAKKTKNTVLIFAPSAREVRAIELYLTASIGERVISFESWRKIKGERPSGRVIVGARGMIFTQASNISEMVIFDEASEHYWDQRSPFWNLRDVALLKSQLESIPLTFVSGCPSLELARLAESGYIKPARPNKQFIKRRRFSTLPETYHQTVRSGLEQGSVLVSVASKNYINALTCKRCNTKPNCDCGFALKLQSDRRTYCSLCGITSVDLRCNECGGLEFNAQAKGIERIKEEFAKAFPNTPIQIATAEREFSRTSLHSIVISTPGVEPRESSYFGLVLLDGISRVNRPTLRSEEQLANHWFRLLALTNEEAMVYISLPISNRVSQALIAANPYRFSNILLEERKETKLPPYYRIIKVKGESLSALAAQISKEFDGIELSKISKKNELTIRADVANAQEVIGALHSVAKYRGASGKSYLDIEIDPYDI